MHQEKNKKMKKNDLDEDKYTPVPTMIQNFAGDERIADIECGPGHTLAIT
jgi:alpha-tubulin suppressor-like RCC1 family protein